MVKQLLTSLVLCAMASSVPAADVALSDATARKLDAIFSDHGRPDTPGYALGISVDGRLVYARGYGQANLDDRIPITEKTVFHLASLSKQFTAAAIALLVIDGKLSLDDPVGKYVKEVKKYGPALKIKHLVYMTSGIRDYTDRPRLSGMPWFSDFYFTRDEAIDAALRPAALDFSPGEKWSYSNVNYMLLTKIVELTSGQSFAEFMQRRIFFPLGMTATLVDDDTTLIVPRRAIGYTLRTPEILAAAAKVGIAMRPGSGYARMMRVSPHFGGSGVFSDLEDLARWDGNFMNSKIGGSAFVPLMQHREHFQHDKDNDAFGLAYGKYRGLPMWWYSGGDLDGSTYMIRFPDAHLAVICLSNILGGDCEGRSTKVIEILRVQGLLPVREKQPPNTSNYRDLSVRNRNC